MGRVTIIGLGLIGGSWGMALRQAKVGLEVVGHDREPEVAGAARKKGAVDRTEWNLPAAVDQADVVVVATPVGAMRELFGQIAEHLKDGCVVTDTGSAKRQVLAWAEEILPPHVAFVGGDPMAGKEGFGTEAAEATLFAGRRYCLTPSANASPQAIDLVCRLVNAIGAEPYFLDAAEHDGLVAAVNHLPFLASTALVRATTSSASWREMSRMAHAEFREVSRLASGDPAAHASLCETNRDNVLRWLDAYVAELTRLKGLVEAGGDPLRAVFDEAKTARDKWEMRPDEEVGAKADIPSAREQIGQTF
ncbi:MAG: prephenate dehydrogenase, partial [Chloroflexota bacterium]